MTDGVTKQCPRCGKRFSCCQDDISKCGCSTVALNAEVLEHLSLNYKDCLCNTCLEEIKAERELPEKIKALFCWSGGKDSAYCLHKVITEGKYEIVYLLTTLNENFRRVSMHGIREDLLDKQAEALGIPLLKAWVKEGSNSEYEQQMERILVQAKQEGIEHVIFGDIFLEDLRAYREANLAKVNMKAVFPLWKIPTGELLSSFIELKFKTTLCCISDGFLNEDWVGREIDKQFENDLPAEVDPCGENGEYHTFCYDGPVFRYPVDFGKGEKTYKPLPEEFQQRDGTKGFWFIDLLPL